MNPGLVVKLRPTGPWRIGPDSGARNRVDSIYHSDSLYSAVSAAMARLGSLDDWLSATARSPEPAVCFSSCFPFLDEIGFVVPPRTIWPPASPGLMAARVRWKSARFVPLGIVQAILAGQRLDENHWTIDGASECLVPAGRSGPFRTSVRWSAAVDRLTGVTERHSTACIEFRAGAGLWTVVSFADEAANARWQGLVKAAFRLLADTGLGGERSRGWGRAEAPEFIEGMLPGMILGGDSGEPGPDVLPVLPVEEPPPAEPPVKQPEPPPPGPEPPPPAPEPQPPGAPEPVFPSLAGEAELLTAEPILAVAEPPLTVVEEELTVLEPATEPAPQAARAEPGESVHWLLSLYTPSPADTVDWRRGNYTILARGGRVDSPAGSGELKKQLPMVAEGSVLVARSALCGSAPDVAPDGFAHPVFRAGFAVAIPLPGVS